MPFLTEPTEAECFEAEQELLFDVHFRQLDREIRKMVEQDKQKGAKTPIKNNLDLQTHKQRNNKMAYMNKVMLIGNVGRDPEVKITTTGTKKVSFSLATSQKYKDSAGEYKEKTQWHNVVFWGKSGDLIEKMVFKGSSLFIEGELSYRKWEDQNGQQKTVTEINGNNFQILGAKANEQKRDQNQSSTQADYVDDNEDNDLPF